MKIELPQQIFETFLNIEFHENPSSGSRVVSCGQTGGRTDRYDETKCRFSPFCKLAQEQYFYSIKLIFCFPFSFLLNIFDIPYDAWNRRPVLCLASTYKRQQRILWIRLSFPRRI